MMWYSALTGPSPDLRSARRTTTAAIALTTHFNDRHAPHDPHAPRGPGPDSPDARATPGPASAAHPAVDGAVPAVPGPARNVHWPAVVRDSNASAGRGRNNSTHGGPDRKRTARQNLAVAPPQSRKVVAEDRPEVRLARIPRRRVGARRKIASHSADSSSNRHLLMHRNSIGSHMSGRPQRLAGVATGRRHNRPRNRPVRQRTQPPPTGHPHAWI